MKESFRGRGFDYTGEQEILSDTKQKIFYKIFSKAISTSRFKGDRKVSLSTEQPCDWYKKIYDVILIGFASFMK